MLTSPLSPSAMLHCVLGGAAVSWSLSVPSLLLVLLLPSVSRVDEEFPSPPRPRQSAPRTPSASRVTLEILSPRGNSSTLGVLVPLGKSNPPPTPWQSPQEFSSTPEASGLSFQFPTLEDSLARFPRRPATQSISHCVAPWRPPAPAPSASASTSVVSNVAPPPAAVPPGPVSAPLTSSPSAVSSGVGVSVGIITESLADPAF